MTESLLWVEGYRPKTIDDCILSETIKGTLSDLVKDEKGFKPNVHWPVWCW